MRNNARNELDRNGDNLTLNNKNFRIQAATNDQVGDTFLQGEISSKYSVQELTHLFGTPDVGDDRSVYHWQLLINGQVVTIYDYKGRRWMVGGHDRIALEIVQNALTYLRP